MSNRCDLLQISLDKERSSSKKCRNSLVHDTVTLHKAEAGLGQGGRVKGTTARSRVRLFDLRDRKPVGVRRLLLLERALEGVHHVADPEGADGVAADRVPRRREYGVHESVRLASVVPLNNLTCGL